MSMECSGNGLSSCHRFNNCSHANGRDASGRPDPSANSVYGMVEMGSKVDCPALCGDLCILSWFGNDLKQIKLQTSVATLCCDGRFFT